MAGRQVNPEQLAAAKQLLAEGESVANVARTVGVTPQTVYAWIRKSDPRPGGRRRSGSSSSATPQATNEQLTVFFARAASFPAVPMALWVHCDFCADHFARTGPDAAKQLVELSEQHPALRNVMQSIWRYWQEVAWATLLATWIGVPAAHHLAPERIYPALQLVLGLPARAAEHRHNGSTAQHDQPGVTPFAGMDTSSLLAMAQAMGIRFAPTTDGTVSWTAPPAPEATAPGEPAEDAGSSEQAEDSSASAATGSDSDSE
jgi:Helix-turn-helix domain of resolvase